MGCACETQASNVRGTCLRVTSTEFNSTTNTEKPNAGEREDLRGRTKGRAAYLARRRDPFEMRSDEARCLFFLTV
jgi:hypothetical protein